MLRRFHGPSSFHPFSAPAGGWQIDGLAYVDKAERNYEGMTTMILLGGNPSKSSHPANKSSIEKPPKIPIYKRDTATYLSHTVPGPHGPGPHFSTHFPFLSRPIVPQFRHILLPCLFADGNGALPGYS
jgi:hypothetical protein